MTAHNIPFSSPARLPRLVAAFDVVRAWKVQPSSDSPGKLLYQVDDISFLMRTSCALIAKTTAIRLRGGSLCQHFAQLFIDRHQF
jgi:hypothetical protein